MSDTSIIEAAGTIEKLASSECSELVEVEDEKFEFHFDYLGGTIARITPYEPGSHMQSGQGRSVTVCDERSRMEDWRNNAVAFDSKTPAHQVRFDPQRRHRASWRPRSLARSLRRSNSRHHNHIG